MQPVTGRGGQDEPMRHIFLAVEWKADSGKEKCASASFIP